MKLTARLLPALVTLGVLAMVGCTSAEDAPQPDPSVPLPDVTVGFEPVAVPGILRATTPRVASQSLVPPARGAAALVVTRSELPDSTSSIQLWTPGRGSEPVGTIVQPRATSLAADGSATVAAVAGDKREGRRRGLWVAVSTDRTRWRDLPLDPTSARLGLGTVGVVGDRVVVAARDDDHAQFLSISTTTKAGPFVRLPPPSGGAEATATAVTGHDTSLLLLRQVGPRGGDTVPHALVSPDAGRTWSEHRVTGLDSASGVVWTGKEYVATGWARTSGGDKHVAAAARSRDGHTWTAEEIPLPATPNHVTRTQSLLGPPTVSHDAVQARFGCSCIASVVVERSAEGSWTAVRETKGSHHTSATGRAWRDASGPHLSLVDRSSLVSYSTSPVTDLLQPTTLVRATVPPTVSDVLDVGGLELVTASRPSLSVEPDGTWSQTGLPFTFVHGADGITESRDGTARLAGLDDLAGASSGEASVLIGTRFTKDPNGGGDWRVASLSRAGRTGPWKSGNGLELDDFTVAGDVVRAGELWYAAVVAAPNSQLSTDRRARVARSRDGVTWAPMPGDWDKGNAGSSIADLCVSHSGEPLGVGWVLAPDRRHHHVAVWTMAGGRWTVTSTVDEKGSSSFATRCSSIGDRTIVSGEARARGATWTAGDGTSLGRPTLAGEGETRGPADVFGAAVIAPGSTSRHDDTGPVIWVSDDGSRWRAVPLPEDAMAESVATYRTSSGPLVVAETPGGTRAWRITGLPGPAATPTVSASVFSSS